jgi:hypothetical protein
VVAPRAALALTARGVTVGSERSDVSKRQEVVYPDAGRTAMGREPAPRNARRDATPHVLHLSISALGREVTVRKGTDAL